MGTSSSSNHGGKTSIYIHVYIQPYFLGETRRAVVSPPGYSRGDACPKDLGDPCFLGRAHLGFRV